MEPLRVLELYSGVGGMHHALRESCIPAQVVAAIDVNTVANEVYKYNFPHTQLLAKTIEMYMKGMVTGLHITFAK